MLLSFLKHCVSLRKVRTWWAGRITLGTKKTDIRTNGLSCLLESVSSNYKFFGIVQNDFKWKFLKTLCFAMEGTWWAGRITLGTKKTDIRMNRLSCLLNIFHLIKIFFGIVQYHFNWKILKTLFHYRRYMMKRPYNAWDWKNGQ